MFNYNFFEKISQEIIGERLAERPKEIFGGLSHRIFKLQTENADYAVKILDERITNCPEELFRINETERAAQKFSDVGIESRTALKLQGSVLQKQEGLYFFVYPWLEGKHASLNEIGVKKQEIIGSLLAKIHTVSVEKFEDIKLVKSEKKLLTTDYKKLKEGLSRDWEELSDLLGEKMGFLVELQKKANKYAPQMDEQVMSHRDLDIYNVIWEDDSPKVIDWELAGYINALGELVRVALYWSGYIKASVDYTKLAAVFRMYFAERKLPEIDEIELKKAFYYAIYDWLDWFDFNLTKASCGKATDISQKRAADEAKRQIIALCHLKSREINVIEIAFTQYNFSLKKNKGED